MNLVLISCLLLFVIYFSIAGLLVYYFFREREIWNIFFEEIYQDFQSLVSGCPIHNTIGLFIPGFVYSRDAKDDGCYECTREDDIRDSNLYNVKTLYNIHILFKTLDANVLVLEDANISSRCKMFQLLLEYIIRNYKELSNGDYTLYKRLQMLYLNEVNKAVPPRINKFSKLKGIDIEIIPILEEYAKTFEKLDYICQQINIEKVSSTFILAFYQDFKHLITDSRKYLFDLFDLFD